MTTRSQEGTKNSVPNDNNAANAANLPATQILVDDTDSPTASLPTQDRNPRLGNIQSTEQDADAPNALNGRDDDNNNLSDSFHRRIHDEQQQQQQHHHQQQQEASRSFILGAESMCEEWIPASQRTSAGWSYSEGDEVNVPETTLPGDAQYSQIDAATAAAGGVGGRGDVAAQQQLQALLRQHYGPGGYTIIAHKPQRKGVKERYPALQHRQQGDEQSVMPSVGQPTPGAGADCDGEGNGERGEMSSMSPPSSGRAAAKNLDKTAGAGGGGGVEGARMMPTPQQQQHGSSAAQRNLTPEEKQAIEGRKQAALARRAEREEQQQQQQRSSKVARNLYFGGDVTTQQHHHQQQQQQQQLPNQPNPAPQQQPQPRSSPASTLGPTQAQRAEENRQRALTIRQNKLMEEAVALAHAVLASQPPPSANSGSGSSSGGIVMPANLTGWKARIEQDVRKIITAQRYSAHGTPSTSQLSTPPQTGTNSAPAPAPTSGGGASQLSPEQRQRVEENKQRALQRQRDKIEQSVAGFFNAAMQRAQHEVALAARARAAATQRAPQQRQQQRQQQQQPIDQTFTRFL